MIAESMAISICSRASHWRAWELFWAETWDSYGLTPSSEFKWTSSQADLSANCSSVFRTILNSFRTNVGPVVVEVREESGRERLWSGVDYREG
jgi:hypothetical protein